MAAMMWQCYDGRIAEMSPPMGALCVVRLGSVSFRVARYKLGRFYAEQTEEGRASVMFEDSSGAVEPVSRWRKYYTDIRFALVTTPEGGVVNG